MANRNNTPTLRLATVQVGVKGITANAKSEVSMMMAGATTNTALSANGGIQSSLKKILTMSATTCNEPKRPTRLGP